MATKIYTQGNYIYIEKDNNILLLLSKTESRFTILGNDFSVFQIYNKSTATLTVGDTTDENDNILTFLEIQDFLENNTALN